MCLTSSKWFMWQFFMLRPLCWEHDPNYTNKFYLSGSECFFSLLKGPIGHGLIIGGPGGRTCTPGPWAISKKASNRLEGPSEKLGVKTRSLEGDVAPAWHPSWDPPVCVCRRKFTFLINKPPNKTFRILRWRDGLKNFLVKHDQKKTFYSQSMKVAITRDIITYLFYLNGFESIITYWLKICQIPNAQRSWLVENGIRLDAIDWLGLII